MPCNPCTVATDLRTTSSFFVCGELGETNALVNLKQAYMLRLIRGESELGGAEGVHKRRMPNRKVGCEFVEQPVFHTSPVLELIIEAHSFGPPHCNGFSLHYESVISSTSLLDIETFTITRVDCIPVLCHQIYWRGLIIRLKPPRIKKESDRSKELLGYFLRADGMPAIRPSMVL